MRFADDSRAVSTIIGALFVFSFLIAGLVLNQVQVVPSENKEVEFEHYQSVQEDMTALGSETVAVAGRNITSSTTIDLGVRYPSRTFALNPPPAAGSLQKQPSGNIEIIKNDGSRIAEDLCGGGTSTFGIAYQPAYNELSTSNIVYENGQVYVNGSSGDAMLDSRVLINSTTQTIDIYRLSGSVPSEAAIRPTSVDITGSAITGKATGVGVDELTFPSDLSASNWESSVIDDSGNSALDAVETSQGVRVEGFDSEYTIRCRTLGLEGAQPETDFASEFKTTPGGSGPGDGGSSGDVGIGGESEYPNVTSATLSTKGGLWTNISEVDAIIIDQPRFSPTRAGDGDRQKQKRHLRTVLGVQNESSFPRYYIDIGGDEGLQYQTGKTDWQNSEITIIKEEQDGSVTEETTNIDQSALSPEEFRDGDPFNPLNFDNVTAGSTSTYADFAREIRKMLRNSDDAELFVTDQHGRVRAQLADVSYPSESTTYLVVDDGSANTAPKAIDLDDSPDGYDDTYEAAKVGLVNTETEPIDKVTDIEIEVVGGGNNAKELDAPGLDRDSYGAEVYFSGNNNDGYIDDDGNSFTLPFDESFASGSDDRQVGDIDADSGIVLKISSFRGNNGKDVDMQGKELDITVTFEVDGTTQTETVTATLDETADA